MRLERLTHLPRFAQMIIGQAMDLNLGILAPEVCALNHCVEQHHGLEGRNSNIPTVEESTLHIKAQIASEAHGQVDAT